LGSRKEIERSSGKAEAVERVMRKRRAGVRRWDQSVIEEERGGGGDSYRQLTTYADNRVLTERH